MEYNYVENLDRVKSWIDNCDMKISFAITFEVFLLGAIFANSNLKHVLNFEHGYNYFQIASIILFIVTLIVLIISLIQFYNGLKANYKIDKKTELNKNSILFFYTIVENDFMNFKKRVSDSTPYGIEHDYLSQIYINSKICTKKFKFYNSGLKWLFISIIPLILYNILYALI